MNIREGGKEAYTTSFEDVHHDTTNKCRRRRDERVRERDERERVVPPS